MKLLNSYIKREGKIKITPDTNILVSGTFWSGDSFRILNLIDKNFLLCVLSKDIIKEYEKIIRSDDIIEKIDKKGLIISKIIKRVRKKSEIINPRIKLRVVKEDPDDDKILECALEGKVDFILTNDKHLLKIKEFKGIRIINPKEFLENVH